MAIAESILPEFDHEMASTRSLVERVPEENADWKPHPKSMSIGGLSLHLANIPTWAVMALNGNEYDVNPVDGSKWTPPVYESKEKTLETFDANVSAAREAIASASDEALQQPWTLKNGGNPVFTMPRIGVLRAFVMSHSIHHRGQLDVYLRLNDVPLPQIYGPTADSPM